MEGHMQLILMNGKEVRDSLGDLESFEEDGRKFYPKNNKRKDYKSENFDRRDSWKE